jgi:hypothetical protein
VLEGSAKSDLLKGWNLVGYGKMKSTMASSLLAGVTGCNAWVITSLDYTTGLYKSYVKGDGPDEDFVVSPGRAYYVWSDAAGQIVYG